MKFSLNDPTAILIAAEEYLEKSSVRYDKEMLKTYILTRIIDCRENIQLTWDPSPYRKMYMHGFGGTRQTVTWQTIRKWLDNYEEN